MPLFHDYVRRQPTCLMLSLSETMLHRSGLSNEHGSATTRPTSREPAWESTQRWMCERWVSLGWLALHSAWVEPLTRYAAGISRKCSPGAVLANSLEAAAELKLPPEPQLQLTCGDQRIDPNQFDHRPILRLLSRQTLPHNAIMYTFRAAQDDYSTLAVRIASKTTFVNSFVPKMSLLYSTRSRRLPRFAGGLTA